jgi:uncharacterized membrane protein
VSQTQDPLPDGARAAKRPTTVLAGRYGHPLHPALVALPIGFWTASVLLDLGSRVVDAAPTAAHAAWWLLGLGVLAALAAACFGFLDLLAIPPGTRAWQVALAHMSCNLGATTLFAVAWVVRRDDVAPAGGTSWPHLLLSLAALVLLGAGGFLGGELAYRYGVRVADEQSQADGFTSRTGGRRRAVPAGGGDGGAVPAARADDAVPADRGSGTRSPRTTKES